MDNEFKEGAAAFAKPVHHVKTIAFDLQAAMAGATIAQKNGRPAEFLAFCEKAIFPLVILTAPNNVIHTYRADGTSVSDDHDEYDLVMVVPVETRYVNLFADGNASVRGSGEHFATSVEAEEQARHWIESGGTPLLAIAAPVEVPARSA
ncbi:hypothetical protein QYH69_32435 [Paraburkholderia sp. SARCC-3016]|uniref:hypothetical protein n=1 Tax=Paraburkholderia sp. SARCC-3016 TaxID=3058611 RepID=UPI0028072F33|nr:hypothetical protein [Paraburkholderia sp. SARCC-3016]MDQ7981933.1 hypothetical protein [Paraburkholderia sp. SARCC-3016]